MACSTAQSCHAISLMSKCVPYYHITHCFCILSVHSGGKLTDFRGTLKGSVKFNCCNEDISDLLAVCSLPSLGLLFMSIYHQSAVISNIGFMEHGQRPSYSYYYLWQLWVWVHGHRAQGLSLLFTSCAHVIFRKLKSDLNAICFWRRKQGLVKLNLIFICQITTKKIRLWYAYFSEMNKVFYTWNDIFQCITCII